MKHAFYIVPVLALLLGWAGCAAPPPPAGGLVVTIEPLAKLVAPLLPSGMAVHRLLPPNASPHAYEPSARDAQTVAKGRILIYVDEGLDGWAADLAAPERIQVSDFLPESARRGIELASDHDHGDHDHGHHHPEGAFNPHFWTDPLSVAAVVPGLAQALAAADPQNAAHYRASGEALVAAMQTLDTELAEILAPVRGAAVAQFHPSWDYLLARYGLRVVGLVEPAPGKEGSPRYLESLISKLRDAQVRVVFTEPQLPVRPAEVVAEAIGAKLVSMDPMGGQGTGPGNYRDWLLESARVLRAAL